MFEIEYGADYRDSYSVFDNDWDRAMSTLSQGLASLVNRGHISRDEYEQGMEWITGVVIDDENVRVSATFGDNLTVGITVLGEDD